MISIRSDCVRFRRFSSRTLADVSCGGVNEPVGVGKFEFSAGVRVGWQRGVDAGRGPSAAGQFGRTPEDPVGSGASRTSRRAFSDAAQQQVPGDDRPVSSGKANCPRAGEGLGPGALVDAGRAAAKSRGKDVGGRCHPTFMRYALHEKHHSLNYLPLFILSFG